MVCLVIGFWRLFLGHYDVLPGFTNHDSTLDCVCFSRICFSFILNGLMVS
jgi:hypothetical protein